MNLLLAAYRGLKIKRDYYGPMATRTRKANHVRFDLRYGGMPVGFLEFDQYKGGETECDHVAK